MNILCDTHVLLWYLEGRMDMFTPETVDMLMDESRTLYFSDVSIWEIAIKHSLKREDFVHDPQLVVDELQDQGFVNLPIRQRHIMHAVSLPWRHRDPFDRLLLCQAAIDGLLLITRDRQMLRYEEVLVRLA